MFVMEYRELSVRTKNRHVLFSLSLCIEYLDCYPNREVSTWWVFFFLEFHFKFYRSQKPIIRSTLTKYGRTRVNYFNNIFKIDFSNSKFYRPFPLHCSHLGVLYQLEWIIFTLYCSNITFDFLSKFPYFPQKLHRLRCNWCSSKCLLTKNEMDLN